MLLSRLYRKEFLKALLKTHGDSLNCIYKCGRHPITKQTNQNRTVRMQTIQTTQISKSRKAQHKVKRYNKQGSCLKIKVIKLIMQKVFDDDDDEVEVSAKDAEDCRDGKENQ